MSRKSFFFFWTFLLISAFLVRVGIAFYWDHKVINEQENLNNANTDPVNNSLPVVFFFGDSDSYWRLGRALAFNLPYEFDDERHWQIFRTPGYPAILTPLFWIFGENPPTIAARLLGAFFGTVNVGLVGIFSLLLFSPPPSKSQWISPLAGIFAAFEPTMVFQSVLILSEETFLTFSLLQYLCALSLARTLGLLPFPTRDMRIFPQEHTYLEWKSLHPITLTKIFFMAFLLGLSTAITVYIRPSWILFLPFAFFAIVVFRFLVGNVHELEDYFYTHYEISFSWVKFLFATTVTSAVFFAILSPWIVRNYHLTKQIIPTSLQMGASLYDGLNPTATGASNMQFVDEFRRLEERSPSNNPNLHFEVRLNERMKKAALTWSYSHPRDVIRLAIIKITHLWAPFPREKTFSKPLIKVCLAVSFLPIFVLGLISAFISLLRHATSWVLLLPALYVTILHSIFVSSIRYRTPVLYGFLILSAYLVVCVICRLKQAFNHKKQLYQL